ncbi:MAG: cob(I)yrinic acid a,c-diamide adenosyltransferase [Myxococcota bacterium]
MKIYTRRGDAGQTDLFGGARVGKDDRRIEACGAVDELNAAIGVCAAASANDDLRALLLQLQPTLFDLGAHLASPDVDDPAKRGGPAATAGEVEGLERHIDAFEAELAPLQRFILPGGTPASAALHVARTVCRRAERRIVTLDRSQPVGEFALRFVNRLSDLLFVMARLENHRSDVSDVEWVGRRR